MNWAYVHLLLNHHAVFGTIFGMLLLLLALWRKSEELKRVSLGVFVLTALIALPVYFTGEPAEKVVERLPGVTELVIARHENAALFALLITGLTGGVALMGLVLFRRAERLPSWIVASVLALSIAASGLMSWAADLGGQVRHTEIRADFKAPEQTETESEQKLQEEKEK
ncbi:MAG TPA: hypothetical protein VI260_07450 [Blastocatellia bacterium]|jgi:hypothetical protein